MKRILLLSCVLLGLFVVFAAGFKTALVREHVRLEHNKQVLRRALKEVWSDPDLNGAMKAADELYAPDFVLHDWTGDSYGLREAKKASPKLVQHSLTGVRRYWTLWPRGTWS